MGRVFIGALLLFISNINVMSAKSHNKKDSYGFQGVRGKRELSYDKNIENDYANLNQIVNDITTTIPNNGVDEDTENNTYEYDGETHYYRDLPNLSITKREQDEFSGLHTTQKNTEFRILNKRAPSGFQGMRGKKLLLNYPIRYSPKRAPSGFMGMRGKKYFTDQYTPKRAPSGFFGMRGKKSDNQNEEHMNGNDNQVDEENELYEFLQKERQLLDEMNGILPYTVLRYTVPSNSDVSEVQQDKRTPSSGFMGMRGKKMVENEDESHSYESDLEKRAPSGFMGMRGKKSVNNNEYFQDKRAPSGFQGMRGKKDSYFAESEEKRAPAAGFFGMRGKKQPAPQYLAQGSGFFGTRGKKGPFEFRGKFVGVRGKKFADNSLNNCKNGLQGLSSQELQSSISVGLDSTDSISNNRLGNIGFKIMRGNQISDGSTGK